MRFSPTIRLAFLSVIIVMTASAIGFRASVSALNMYLRKEPAPLREALDTIPTKLGRWKRVGVDSRLGEAMVESLGTRFYLDRQYAIDGNPSNGVLTLHIAYYTGMVDAVPHVPERCWGAAGLNMLTQPANKLVPIDRSKWDLVSGPKNGPTGESYPIARVVDAVTRRDESVYMPIGETEMSVTVFQDDSNPDFRLVGGYLFIANARFTSSPYVVKTYAFDLSSRYSYYCKVQCSMLVKDGDQAVEKWTERTAELLSELLPNLMRRLPDWTLIEANQSKE
ncbi:MAG: exosortase-associated EpsI family protein [Planctomycetota bacterium]|nr:exosortase-associated EpsI family protein [Planctomycetota bacterium]